MNQSNELVLQWWKLACEYNPDPVAFVDINDNFIFCNTAWCLLIGWSESELEEKTWFDITRLDGVGGDGSEFDKIKSGEKQEYYLETTYLRKNKTEIGVSLYVHRYPSYGNVEGFIVFARKLSSKEHDDLKNKFLELSKKVLELQQHSLIFTNLVNKVALIENQLEYTKDFLKNIMNKANGNINIGDNVGGDNVGRDKISNQSILMMIMAGFCGLTVITLIALLLSGTVKLQHKDSNFEVTPNVKTINK